MQSVVASSRSNGSTISQANTGGGVGLMEHDYIGLSEASSSSQTCEYPPAAAQRPSDCNGGFGETDLKLGLSLTAGSYKADNLGYGLERTFHQGPTQAHSQAQCQWVCQDGGDRSYPLPPPPPPPSLKVSQDEYQWCAAAAGKSGCNEKAGAGGWPRGFEHWVPQDRSSPSSQSMWQGQVLRGREGARILTAQDLQAPPPPPPPVSSITQDVVEGRRSGYGFPNPGRVAMPAMAGTKRVRTESVEPDGLHDSSTNPKGQVVGWPPIKSYRKNTLASQPKPAGEVGQEEGVPPSQPVQNQGSSLFVKVNMDGVPIGRKVDLNAHGSYETLALALEDMFHRSSGQSGAQAPVEKGHGVVNDSKPSRLLDSSSEYVLTYEDREGDWMLVGDVPWRMFVSSVKRLRIMKTSEANGLAPRCSEKMSRQKNKAV